MRVSEGTLTSSFSHPARPFGESPAPVIFVHNHPSGDPEPGRDDIQITGRPEQAAEMLGIKLLDPVIVGDGRNASMLG